MGIGDWGLGIGPNVWVYPATVKDDGIVINWRKETGVDGYRIYRRFDTNWTMIGSIKNADTVTYTDYSAEDGVDYYYDVVAVVNGARGSLDYNGIPAKIEEKTHIELSIITQPKDVYVEKDNELVKFSVEATGKEINYMWYAKTNESGRFIKSGVNDTEYTRHMSAKLDGMQVYCVITDAYGNKVTTDIATSYYGKEFKINTDTADVVVPKMYDYGTFTIDAQGVDVSYSWYAKKTDEAGGDGKFHKVGCFTNEYTVRAYDKTKGMQVYCVVTNATGEKIIGRTATLSIDDQKLDVTYPNGKELSVKSGKKAEFCIEVNDKNATYSWYCMVPVEAGGDGKFHKAGCYENVYVRTASKKTDGMQAYCNITDSKGRITKSDIIVLNVQ